MCASWSSAALMSGAYHGRPMHKHLSLPVDPKHFDRWLMLVATTAHEVCPHEAVAHFIKPAQRVTESSELRVAGAQGVLLGRGERLIVD